MALACMLSGLIIEKFGRKTIFQVMSVPFVVGWMILYFSMNIYVLMLGRIVTGFCAGILSTPVPVYISEITQPTYRGLFTATQGLAVSAGILLPHALGIYMKWEFVAIVCALVPLFGYILIEMVPESPAWLVDHGQMDKAAKAFTWFRGQYLDSKYEFEKLVEGQKLAKLQNDSISLHNILMMGQSKSFYKPLLILLVYSITVHGAGTNVIAFYTVQILKSSIGRNVDEYVGTIILDVTRLVAALLSCILITNVGRRSLTAISGIATAITLFGLSAYLYCVEIYDGLANFYEIPLTLYTLYVLFLTIGLSPLILTLTGELFPLRYRGMGSALVTFSSFICYFITVKITPELFETFGQQVVFLVFGMCCLIGTVIVITFLPETRNKTLQEIEESYTRKKKKSTARVTFAT